MNLVIPDIEPGSPHYTGGTGSFDLLVKAWISQGRELVSSVTNSSNPHYWLNEVGDVLLYQWPTLEHLSPKTKYRLGLFANSTSPVNGMENKRWTFWPRNSTVNEQFFALGREGYDTNRYRCCFIGHIENKIQRGYRHLPYWSKCLDFLYVGRTLSNYKYMRTLRESRYGLCLPGYGPHCHREIECMSVGTIPIFTPGVGNNYHEQLVQGKHYLFARSVEDVVEIVKSTSPDQWEEMSWQGMDWYWRNASPAGSFNRAKQIVEEYD